MKFSTSIIAFLSTSSFTLVSASVRDTRRDSRLSHDKATSQRSLSIKAATCQDSPANWHDSYPDDNGVYGYEYYAVGDTCKNEGDQFPNMGKTANEACCACGGGSASSGNGTPITTPPTTSTPSNPSNPIQVPANLVPTGIDPSRTDSACRFVDLSSVSPPSNPGYPGESIANESLTGDQIWETSFYMMFFTNCERQARGVEPFKMDSDDKMIEMQKTYIFKGAHDGYEERSQIASGMPSEGTGGGPLPGAGIWSIDTKEDNNGNGVWDPQEAGRRSTSNLVDHGDSMIHPKYSCVYATITIDPNDDERFLSILFYGDIC